MDAEALREAITREMMDYRRPKLLTLKSPYNLCPVTISTCSEDSMSSVHVGAVSQPSTDSTIGNTFGKSLTSDCVESTTDPDIVNGINGSASVGLNLGVPEICTVNVTVDGNSVEMPSATRCRPVELQSDDITMLSARSVDNSDVQLKEEVRQATSVNSSNQTATDTVENNRTDSAIMKDNWNNSTVPVITDGRPDTNSLVISTDLPQTADAKARIKAALLNSGRRRQRLRKSVETCNHYKLIICM